MTWILDNTLPHLRTTLIPILALFDYAAAFLSAAREWIHIVLEAKGIPLGFRNFVKALCANAAAYMQINGSLRFCFWFDAGVLQGCPASAFIFNAIVDPF